MLELTVETPNEFRPRLSSWTERSVSRIAFAFLMVVGIPAQTLAQIPPSASRSPEELALAFREVRSDPPPAQLCKNSHFLISDESDHWLFRPDIEGLGGALIGVGTDSNFLLAGWSQSDLLILMDFDQVVVDLHGLYRLCFQHAKTPQEFFELWAKDSAARVEALVLQHVPAPAEQQRALRALRLGKRLVAMRLRTQRRHYQKLGIATYLDDQVQYDHVARLFLENRVLSVRGDLTGNKTMRDVASLCKRLAVPVRVLYLSNAEAYFDYNSSFRENMLALPVDEKSIVLRTSRSENDPWTASNFYRYYIQRADDFRKWMGNTNVVKASALRGSRNRGKHQGLYYLGPPGGKAMKQPIKAASSPGPLRPDPE